MKPDSLPTFRENGFTKLELLVVIVAIAILAAFTLRPITISHPASPRNRTIAAHAVIRSGLEQYKEIHGEYPAPANPTATVEFAGKDIQDGSARMLYQALTGDGNNEILRTTAGTRASDGQISEEESENTINGNLPKAMVVRSIDGYYLVDGWARPFQYTKGGGEDSLNPTYDLWSFGPTRSKGPLFYDAESRRSGENTATWIKNW